MNPAPSHEFTVVNQLQIADSKHSTERCFPSQLFDMLESLEANGQTDICSWLPHGRAFRVHKKTEFMKSVLPVWFRHSNYSSFQRQLNIYGFTRILQGIDKNAYYHEHFIKGEYHRTLHIGRQAIKGADAVRKPLDRKKEPNFYRISAKSLSEEMGTSLRSTLSKIPNGDGARGIVIPSLGSLLHSLEDERTNGFYPSLLSSSFLSRHHRYGLDITANSVARTNPPILPTSLYSTLSEGTNRPWSNNLMSNLPSSALLAALLQNPLRTTPTPGLNNFQSRRFLESAFISQPDSGVVTQAQALLAALRSDLATGIVQPSSMESMALQLLLQEDSVNLGRNEQVH